MSFAFTRELCCRGVKQAFQDMTTGGACHWGNIVFDKINSVKGRRYVVGTEFASKPVLWRWDYTNYDDFVFDIGCNRLYVRVTFDDV